VWITGALLDGVRWIVTTGLCVAVAFIARRMLRTEPEIVEYIEPDPTPDEWFLDLCDDARVPMPLVVKDYPTEVGHAFHLLVTDPTDRTKTPLTVEGFAEFDSRLRDCAGIGCTGVNTIRDEQNGGRAITYVNGIRLAPWNGCSIEGCAEAPAWHAWELDGGHSLACNTHRNALDGHVHRWDQTGCAGWECWNTHALDVWFAAWEPLRHAAHKKCPAPPQPLPAQHLVHESGAGERGPWAAPDPGTRVPPGANPGTGPGRMWAALTTERRPFARHELASAANLSVTQVSRHLDAWHRLGHVTKIGRTWLAAGAQPTSASIPPRGDEGE
jgi:hypothetical protein